MTPPRTQIGWSNQFVCHCLPHLDRELISGSFSRAIPTASLLLSSITVMLALTRRYTSSSSTRAIAAICCYHCHPDELSVLMASAYLPVLVPAPRARPHIAPSAELMPEVYRRLNIWADKSSGDSLEASLHEHSVTLLLKVWPDSDDPFLTSSSAKAAPGLRPPLALNMY